jgi:hypothetical protein
MVEKPSEPFKPYTVPPGYKAPTLGEQFRYVRSVINRKHVSQKFPPTVSRSHSLPSLSLFLIQAFLKHPYYRYGYTAALLVGLIGWGLGYQQNRHKK